MTPGSAARPLRWDTALAVALVVVVVLGTQISSQFLSSYNLFTLCTNIGDLAIMALPMTLIIITGEIDLSVASILALSARDARVPVDAPLADGADLRRGARGRGRRRARSTAC